ncbi:HAMP domain-containing sensor histidine kinase [Sphingomonas sp. LY160]|uniref:sensor histidine kinase n=1 Tax=Sphingomonas sp. LY160 TaxID=3095342 RepID=UPI002ADEC7E8|nr:HAMP domain-containing sensor histidine kinase [Sphingomonas sp. LY160]MEA1071381.1 HAMP domain-containing sensor histidine kinase [Sphingomonas sp. LY160]
MASVSLNGDPVSGRVDRDGRLIEADPRLLRLQREAGSDLGALIALPQLAMVVRTAIRLGVPLSRSIIAASSTEDLDLWVKAVPDQEGVSLAIEGWTARSPLPPRLTLVGNEPELGADAVASGSLRLSTDPQLQVLSADEGLPALLGLDEGEVVGEPLTRFFQLRDDAQGAMPLLSALGTGQAFAGQMAHLRNDPKQIVSLSGNPKETAGGKFAGFEIDAHFEGVSDQRDGQASFDPALNEALRSPLDRIISAADRIVERTEGPLRSDYATYAGDIAAAGRHLLSVIKAMTEEQPTSADVIDLRGPIAEAVQLTEVRAEERSIIVAVTGAADALLAHGEPRAIVQILVNIVNNAIRHSPVGGLVDIAAHRRGEEVAITVTDQGPGIAPVDEKRVFERYERVGEAPDGTGLGLAIARRLARSMGGEIELDGRPGRGACFTLTLRGA